MQKHIVIKPARSCSGNKTRLKAFAGLATDRIWRTPIHKTGGELDVRLDEFYLWCEAKTIFRSRGTRLVHRHAKKRGQLDFLRHIRCTMAIKTNPQVVADGVDEISEYISASFSYNYSSFRCLPAFNSVRSIQVQVVIRRNCSVNSKLIWVEEVYIP